jgi:hypothetical protein
MARQGYDKAETAAHFNIALYHVNRVARAGQVVFPDFPQARAIRSLWAEIAQGRAEIAAGDASSRPTRHDTSAPN